MCLKKYETMSSVFIVLLFFLENSFTQFDTYKIIKFHRLKQYQIEQINYR